MWRLLRIVNPKNGAGGITVDPKQLSERELEKLTRKLVQVKHIGFHSNFELMEGCCNTPLLVL
jgi:glutamate dehydrogenase